MVSRKETGANCDLIKYVVHVNFSTLLKLRKQLGFEKKEPAK